MSAPRSMSATRVWQTNRGRGTSSAPASESFLPQAGTGRRIVGAGPRRRLGGSFCGALTALRLPRAGNGKRIVGAGPRRHLPADRTRSRRRRLLSSRLENACVAIRVVRNVCAVMPMRVQQTTCALAQFRLKVWNLVWLKLDMASVKWLAECVAADGRPDTAYVGAICACALALV